MQRIRSKTYPISRTNYFLAWSTTLIKRTSGKRNLNVSQKITDYLSSFHVKQCQQKSFVYVFTAEETLPSFRNVFVSKMNRPKRVTLKSCLPNFGRASWVDLTDDTRTQIDYPWPLNKEQATRSGIECNGIEIGWTKSYWELSLLIERKLMVVSIKTIRLWKISMEKVIFHC